MFGQSSQNANKSICQFYQRGNCKYGNNCFNLHPGAPGAAASNVFGRSTSSSSLGFTSYDKSNALQDTQFLEFVKQIITEMKMWETNGLWQLSCLAPLKEHPPIAEFVDTSPEELRVEAYEALKANDSTTYQTSFNNKFEYQKQLRQALKNRHPEAIEVLKNVYYKTGSNSTTTGTGSSSTNMFGKPSGSFFENSTSQTSIFGGASTGNKNSSVFGGAPNLGANNIFGAKPQTSALGGTSLFGSNTLGGGSTFKTTFGSNQSSSLFVGTTNKESSQNIFGNQQNQGFGGASNGSTGIFGTNSNTSGSSNVFGTNTNTSNSNSIFGSNTNTTGSNSLFGTNTTNGGSNSLFGTSSNSGGSNSIFGANANATGSNSLFGTNANNSGPNSLFGNNNISTSSSSSLFGTNTNTNGSNSFGTNASTNGVNNIFGTNTNSSGSNSLFGSNINSGGSTNIFGSNASNGSSGIFGNNTSTTGSSNVFGTNIANNTALNQNSSIPFGSGSGPTQQEFGTSAFGSQNLFNKSQGTTNVFGIGTNQNVQPSLLGNAPETKDNQASVFGGGSVSANNVFGGGNIDQNSNLADAMGNKFGVGEQSQGETTSSTSSIFGNNFDNKSGVLGTSVLNADSNKNSIFSTHAGQNVVSENNIFSGNKVANNSNTVSIFGNQSTSAGIAKPPTNTSLFGTSTQNVSSSENLNDLIYTPLHLLSIGDKTEFERDVFLRIPLIPPPKELCF